MIFCLQMINKYKVKFKVCKLPMEAGNSVPIIFVGFGFDCFKAQLLWFTLTVIKRKDNE